MIKLSDIHPIGDHVAIRPIQVDAHQGLIVIPDSAKDATFVGEVLAVGELCESVIRKGQRVIYPKYGGSSIEVDSTEVIFMPETDILAVVKSNA